MPRIGPATRRSLTLLVCGALLQLACGGASCPTCPPQLACPSPTPTPAPTPDLRGLWWGGDVRRDAGPLLTSFTVGDQRVLRNLWVNLNDSEYRRSHSCSPLSAAAFAPDDNYPITDGRSTVEFGDSPFVFIYNVQITFETATTAHVRVTVADYTSACQGRSVTHETTVTKHPFL